MLSDTDICYCGHVRDEHEDGAPCTVKDCKCIHFEHDPEAKADAEED